jgi:hypothetical protein
VSAAHALPIEVATLRPSVSLAPDPDDAEDFLSVFKIPHSLEVVNAFYRAKRRRLTYWQNTTSFERPRLLLSWIPISTSETIGVSNRSVTLKDEWVKNRKNKANHHSS